MVGMSEIRLEMGKIAPLLIKFGEINQCEIKGGMFHLHIGTGFKNNFHWILDVKTILEEHRVFEAYPAIHKCDIDTDKFWMVLKPCAK